MKPKIAISVGDLNGVGIEIVLKSHKKISQFCEPIYCINTYMLNQVSTLLHVEIPDNFNILHVEGKFDIEIGKVTLNSGLYSYNSFMQGINLCETNKADAIVTLPIHKEAWKMAGLDYVGHTDLLRQHFKRDAIMMLGCEKMFVSLYTEHIPLKDVASAVNVEKLTIFLLDLYTCLDVDKVAVLGLNPHAGDNGVLGDEEEIIKHCINYVNDKIGEKIFVGPIVPDIAFTPHARKQYKHFVAMYHDQGLAPLKALYFDESINVSLNLPIIRTSVDHGTAFDIAYKGKVKTLSYINAVKSAISFI